MEQQTRIRLADLKGNWSLVTGASSGIGLEFARQLAALGTHLVLIARREAALQELAGKLQQEYGIETLIIPADLSSPADLETIFSTVKARQIQPLLVVNNAGSGCVVDVANADRHVMTRMINLNVRSVTEISYYYLQEMIRNQRGGMINVASIVSFQPVTYMATYAASKAFVLHFTEAIAEEAAKWNLQVMALCPGTTRTEFFDSANAGDWLKRFKGMSAGQVVSTALRSFDAGNRVCVPGLKYKLISCVTRFIPRGYLTRASKSIFQKSLRSRPEQSTSQE